MEQELRKIKRDFSAAVKTLTDIKELERLQTKYLGRKGILTTALRQVKDVAAAERPHLGKLANTVKRELDQIIKEAISKSRDTKPGKTSSHLDTSVPGTKGAIGNLHPITIIQHEMEDAFLRMGFKSIDVPEVESEYYNFTSLNVPDDHPARDAQDTFWLKDGNVLRTHTSTFQVRALQKFGAPFRGFATGKCFRYEATDASHDHTFHQFDGLMVDQDISVGNLTAIMKTFLEYVFNATVDIRLRPGYFPFVEPGFELDIKCLICQGEGCSVCKHVGWLELLGCGLVHPSVLRAGNVDPDVYSGFAFGMGLTRLAMMKYGIDDIRLLMGGDLRFVKQF